MTTPLLAIRQHCTWCCNGAAHVRGCNSPNCGLHRLRFGKRVAGVSPLRATRARCLDCLSSAAEVARCAERDCPLWVYRDGHNPARRGIGNQNPAKANSGLQNRPQNLRPRSRRPEGPEMAATAIDASKGGLSDAD